MRPIRERMQEMARAADDHLPPGYGFIIFAFNFGPGGQMEYCANCQREDGVRALKEWIANVEATGRVDVHQTRSIADQHRDMRAAVRELLAAFNGRQENPDVVISILERLAQLLKEPVK